MEAGDVGSEGRRGGSSRAGDIADAAYLASRAQTHEDCVALDSKFIWDDGDEDMGNVGDGGLLVAPLRRLDEALP
eukprot:1913201-Karenia_brevis.AAC.1